MTTPLTRPVEAHDRVHLRLKAAIEVPTTRCLWIPADAITFTPRVLTKVYGDGRALFTLSTINNRPAYWVIRGDSGWDCAESGAPDDAPDFRDFTDEILTDLEEEFGNARCGYSGANLYLQPDERGCDCEQCTDSTIAEWPEVDGDGGCSWGRMDWPDGFQVIEHPWARAWNLLAPTIETGAANGTAPS